MPGIYCGNNRLSPELVSGEKVLGSRYKCMKRGIGVGLNLPYDPDYAGGYEPISEEKFYCGDKDQLPQGYMRFGTLPQCQGKGVGLGKVMRAEKGPPPKSSKYIGILFVWIVWLILCCGIGAALYYKRPDFVIGEDKKIDWKKFSVYYAPTVLVLTIIAVGSSILLMR